MKSPRNRLDLCAVLLVALGATGCGPVLYATRAGDARESFERAREEGAAERAPFEYYTAEAYLEKAREEAGDGEYQLAIEFARIARRSAEEARATVRSIGGAQ